MAMYSSYRYRNVPPRRKRAGKGKVWLFLVAALVVVLGAWVVLGRGKQTQVDNTTASSHQSAKQTGKAEEPAKLQVVNLQPVVDQWVAKQSGDYGVVVYDPANKQIVASHEPDTQFFTASIYKLYTVYLALQDVQAGKHTLGEDFRFGKTRQTCLHDAIHTSDSPCAEALLNEIGQAEVTARLKAYDLTGTAFPAFTTTAGDSIKILQRLHDKHDLNDASTKLMLDAMKTQVYRDGLPKGMPQATVADKVGFSETPHYHDVGIVTLPNGRDYLVAFFSKGVGSKTVADFGTTIYNKLISN